MIFPSLIEYYNRLYKKGDVPPLGFSNEDIGFAITLAKDGKLVGEPEDLRIKYKLIYTNT